MSATKVQVEGLSKVFQTGHHKVVALAQVDLTISEGQFVCIVGPSGCGKTTLLRMLAGLETPTGGRFLVMQRDKNKPINSMIFQEQSIFPWMTVRDNVAYGLRVRGIRGKAADEVVDYYVAKIGLSSFAKAFPHQLSGGMKQRVSVARAFANDPEILLMDEPFAALDEQNKTLLQEELLRIWEETRKTVVFITHSIDEAVVLGDRVVMMTAHPGQIKADIPIEFPRPRHVYELRAQPAYGELIYRLWDLLREEVVKAKMMEVAR